MLLRRHCQVTLWHILKRLRFQVHSKHVFVLLTLFVIFPHFVKGHAPIENILLLLVKLLVKLVRLRHPVAVELVHEDLLFDDPVWELELVHAVDEELLGEVIARACCALALHRLVAQFLVLEHFLQAKEFIFA